MIMMQPAECLDNLSEYMQSFIESRTYLNKNDPKLFQKIVSYLYLVKLSKDEKNREPLRFEAGIALLREQNEEDDMTDSEIEIEIVPSDPFLFDNCDYDEQKDDQTTKFQENIIKKENFQTHQVEAEVHHGITIHQT